MPESGSSRYAIVSPVRNEAPRIARTLDSVLSQSVRPLRWVIVDDGSTDGTADIVREYGAGAEFITLVALENGGDIESADRLMWAAEAVAFNEGLKLLDLDELDYVVKLDGDLSFDAGYFEGLLHEFEADRLLGIAGGHCYEMRDGERVLEWVPDSHVRGATKMYRIACFRQIGGIEPVYGWDTLDELRAQMAGWRTRSFHPGVDHLKPTGSTGGLLRGRARMGRGTYLLGYHPLFVAARTARLSIAPPYVLGGAAFFGGYLGALLSRARRVADEETVDYLRRQQMQRLRGAVNAVELRSLFGRGDS